MLSGIYCILYELFYTVHCMSNMLTVMCDCHMELNLLLTDSLTYLHTY